jgi:hypothetical protein
VIVADDNNIPPMQKKISRGEGVVFLWHLSLKTIQEDTMSMAVAQAKIPPTSRTFAPNSSTKMTVDEIHTQTEDSARPKTQHETIDFNLFGAIFCG